ncbi:MAG: hypothetical protein WCT42_00500 [Candidatus Paceibacterota bacterium]
MSYIDDEELKLDVDSEEEEEDLETLDGFSDPIDDDLLEDDDLLSEEFKMSEDTE